MSHLRLQHVFMALMGASAISAFVVPPAYSDHFRPQVQMLFAPVSRPARMVASFVCGRVSPEPIEDRRPDVDIRAENRELRAQLAMMQMQLDELARRDAELSKLGSAKELCDVFSVIGADAGSRQSIQIAGSTLRGLRDDQYVLYPGGLVGRIRAGIGGARVQLITDPAFRVRVRFASYVVNKGKTQLEVLGTPTTLVEGAGEGAIVARGLTLADIACDASGKPLPGKEDALRVGDYVQLWDGDSPRRIQGSVLGRVIRITRRPDAPLFAEIRIQPTTNLKKLGEVMVMVR